MFTYLSRIFTGKILSLLLKARAVAREMPKWDLLLPGTADRRRRPPSTFTRALFPLFPFFGESNGLWRPFSLYMKRCML